MRVSRIQVETFIIKVARTREDEAGCDDCARLAARLVQALLSNDLDDQELMTIWLHVQQCIPCGQEFEVLTDCARMDEEDSWPSMDEMWQKLEAEKDKNPNQGKNPPR